MSLLKPTPGEVIDRLSVVLLKIDASNRKGISPSHFLEELSFLTEWISGNIGWQISLSLSEVAWLAQVNLMLWQKTEEQQQFQLPYPGMFDAASMRGAELLIEIRDLNSERVRLREEIDKKLGTFQGREKL